MSGRRRLLAIVVLAAVVHALGIARTVLPAQDGLKFIRIARQFQERAAIDVIRDSDRHPLYPALIALAEPIVAWFNGPGPETWRIAAQGVAALASMALIIPLYGLARSLFGERVAELAALLYVLLPLPAEVGRDTLSDSLALLATLTALRLGASALAAETGSALAFAGCGIAAGIGYLARPEVALVPLAVAITRLARPCGSWRTLKPGAAVVQVASLSVGFLTLAGGYAAAKGEVSEKLALRYGAGIARPHTPGRAVRQWLPPGLDDPRWDFSPKEESLPGETSPPGKRTFTTAVVVVITRWAEGLGGFFGLFALWGAVRARHVRTLISQEPGSEGESGNAALPPRLRTLLNVYLTLDFVVLLRHLLMLGYLSDRHLLSLVTVSLPWAAAGAYVCGRGLARVLSCSPQRAQRLGAALVVAAVVAAIVVPQLKPGHHSRWGHWAAGHWLKEHAQPAEGVLDTRGWASFAANRASYDYWHVRQALTDPHLAYVVVGADELSAPSRRAATLRAILAYAASAVATFPDDQKGKGIGVLVYRYHRPESWEGLRP